ncbi:hypothetical protein [Actinomyces oricola]
MDALEEQLVEHAANVVWRLVVGGRGVLGQVEGLDNEVLPVPQILLQGLDVPISGSQTARDALLLGLEYFQGDSVLVVGLEELVPLMDESLPGGGQLGELLLGVLNHELELVAQGPLQLLTADWLQADVLV